MANWRKTKTPGVYVAHQLRCPGLTTTLVAAAVNHHGVDGVAIR